MNSSSPPKIVALAGPNGAGKSTVGPALLKDALGITRFVNADVIAQGLSAFDPAAVAFEAGRIMLQRIQDLAGRRQSFAFETTLAARVYAPWISELVASGYEFHLLFLWLPSPELAIARVKDRVRVGGHNVPEETIRRRYRRGLRNFAELYRPLATSWRLYENAAAGRPDLVASGGAGRTERIVNPTRWREIMKTVTDEHD